MNTCPIANSISFKKKVQLNQNTILYYGQS